MSGSKVWSFLTIEGDREYQGNEGYDDDPQATYRYDNFVANHREVEVGDLAIIRSASAVLGIAEISEILEAPGTKERFRCPQCGDTNISHRKTLDPPWRCKNLGHEFSKPNAETIPITTYEARYGSTFRKCDDALTLETLGKAVIRPSDQMSIKELNLGKIEGYLGDEISGLLEGFAVRLEPQDIEHPVDQESAKSVIERRKKVLREISVRRGQSQFRKKLIKRYGGRCQVSGCDFLPIIEAAHIDPYAESADNAAGNGLLLRSDIHTLFDLGYLGIEPSSLKVRVHPSLKGSEYHQVDGVELQTVGMKRPASDCIAKRWSFFQKKIAGQ